MIAEGDIPVKAELISHPEERYSASGVPSRVVSMEEASRVTVIGTSLLCPLAIVSIKKVILKSKE
jgi:hypothetical protein